MGKLTGTGKRTLRGQVISSFYLSLVLSIVATLLTWGLIGTFVFFLIQKDQMNLANHYEKQLPEIVNFVHERGDILGEENQEIVESVIPLEGIDYQVLDKNGDLMYGTMSNQYIFSEEDLLKQFNSVKHDGKKKIIYYPIFDEDRSFNGAIAFSYELTVSSANTKISLMIMVVGIFVLVSPFLYFYLFSYFIGKRFSSKIEKPFNEIIESARKIQQHDLDFSLSHITSTVELNQLVSAFEEMKEALKESLHRQWKLEEDRRDMVSAIAHDLKTPLTIILGHVEELLEMKEHHPERIKRYLQTIQSSCHRSTRLIQELHDVSQIEQAEFTLHFSPTHIKKWIQAKAEEYDHLAKSKNITFESIIHKIELKEDHVWVDVFRVNQVLDNVFTNSLHYTPNDGEIKWISSITDEHVCFEMIDNGPGFLSEDKSKIFKKFYREDTSRANQTGHSGLGMYIAKTITEKHGGKIIAKNRPEGGAYVKINIKNMIDNSF